MDAARFNRGYCPKSDAQHLGSSRWLVLVVHVMVAMDDGVHAHRLPELINLRKAVSMGTWCFMSHQDVRALRSQGVEIFLPDRPSTFQRDAIRRMAVLTRCDLGKRFPGFMVGLVGRHPDGSLEVAAQARNPHPLNFHNPAV